MADIKTRDTVKGTIRTLDKAKVASSRMKSAYIQTKDKAEHSTHSEEHSANEYATDRVESGTKRGVEETAHQTKKQFGNVGGQPYWSWYGFGSRVEWCACFVPWCANECGYIEAGVIPKYSVCDTGADWFKERNQWLEGSEEPQVGMIIFFDWEYDGLDGNSDHTGIVEKVEDGRVYTIEGNSGDAYKENSYSIGHYEILGYGCPAY